ncbi:MAG: hypothetical protein M3O70_26755 [Actinomycetota bacterium]|nr:hypothetical protein [Actinomycetota bacterium]
MSKQDRGELTVAAYEGAPYLRIGPDGLACQLPQSGSLGWVVGFQAF